MNTRQAKLLAAIIDQFVQTATPIGSKQFLSATNFSLSGATIRNEMRALGEEGFLDQPHISAGRVPTAKAYQFYVREIMQPSDHEVAVKRKFDALKEQYLKQKDQERVYETVVLLSRMVANIAFATVPHKQRVYFLGLANALRQPEFVSDPTLATGVVEVLEQRLTDLLGKALIDERVQYYIGDTDIFPGVSSCSLLVTRYEMRGEQGHIGILGPMRMDYAYNTVALEMAAELLRSQ
jgi:transcriptional regulator of heat shock response